MTPQSRPYAGHLGPWAAVLRSVIIDPLSRMVVRVHLVMGSLRIVSALSLYLFKSNFAKAILLITALLSACNFPFGTTV